MRMIVLSDLSVYIIFLVFQYNLVQKKFMSPLNSTLSRCNFFSFPQSYLKIILNFVAKRTKILSYNSKLLKSAYKRILTISSDSFEGMGALI